MKPHRTPHLVATRIDLVTQPPHEDSWILFRQQPRAVRNDRKVTGRLAMVDGPLGRPIEAKPAFEKLGCLSWRHGIEYSADREATLGVNGGAKVGQAAA